MKEVFEMIEKLSEEEQKSLLSHWWRANPYLVSHWWLAKEKS